MANVSLEQSLQQLALDPGMRRQEFYRYYSDKRVMHQLKQLEMLRDVPASRLTEIGSYLGFATALFLAAGFKVQTIDAASVEMLGEVSPENHLEKNILDLTPDDLSGQEVVVCCETLEHLYFSDVEEVLNKFHRSGIEWLLISVPYKCSSVDIRLVKNPFSSFLKWIVKFPPIGRSFKQHPEPYGHKWELGYKKYPLKKLTNALNRAGFCVEKVDYAGTVRSVFILSRRTTEFRCG